MYLYQSWPLYFDNPATKVETSGTSTANLTELLASLFPGHGGPKFKVISARRFGYRTKPGRSVPISLYDARRVSFYPRFGLRVSFGRRLRVEIFVGNHAGPFSRTRNSFFRDWYVENQLIKNSQVVYFGLLTRSWRFFLFFLRRLFVTFSIALSYSPHVYAIGGYV